MSLELLRAQTKVAHKSLEESLKLFDKVQTHADYLEHLQKFHSVLAPLEESIKVIASNLLPDWEQRRRAKYLAQDILQLGGQLSRPNQGFATVDSPARVWGILYVLEGSTLGGQYIFKHFAEKLGLDRGSGLSFYGERGVATGGLWKAFLNKLEFFYTQSPELAHESYASAGKTFEAIESALCAQ